MRVFRGLPFVVWLGILLCGPARADIPTGIAWLGAQARPDGSYASTSTSSTPFQSTVETLRTLALLGQAGLPTNPAALSYLAGDAYNGNSYLAPRIMAFSAYGRPVDALGVQLAGQIDEIGVYGELAGYQGTVLDSARALEALAEAGLRPADTLASTVGWLLAAQGADGSWALPANPGDTWVTASVAEALSRYRGDYLGVPEALGAAQAFLLTRRDGTGAWGEDLVTAQVLDGLLPWIADPGLLAPAVEVLRAHQGADGSWGEDVHTTALALRALWLAGQRNTQGSTDATPGGVKGRVIDADTGEPVADAAITVQSTGSFTGRSLGDGVFLVSGIPAGQYTVRVDKPGYLGSYKSVEILAGAVADLGDIPVAQGQSTGAVFLHVYDSATTQGLGGAQLSLSGDTQASTDSSGDLSLPALVPGTYSFNLTRSGYHSVGGQLQLGEGAVLRVRQAMVPEGSYLDQGPVDLTGRVIDGSTGRPLPGAQLALDGGTSNSADSAGAFSFPAVPRGAHSLGLSAPGYVSRDYRIQLDPGMSGVLGDLLLYPSPTVTMPTTLTLNGQVVDSVSGQPLAGASVRLVETGATMAADAEGQFRLSGLRLTDLHLDITAEGHVAEQFTLTVEAFGEVSARFALPPEAQSDPGATSSTLSGLVTDAQTGQPLPGAVVASADGSYRTVSGSDGHYALTGVNDLAFQLTASALGYTAKSYDIALPTHGTYDLPIALSPLPATGDATSPTPAVQVLAVWPDRSPVGAMQTLTVHARIGSLSDQPQAVQVLGEVFDDQGQSVAKLAPVIPGTQTTRTDSELAPGETLELELPWQTEQRPPGSYRLVVRVVEPHTVSAAVPTGRVYAEGQSYAQVSETRTLGGYLDLSPPIAQAGSDQPVQLSALVVNTGNVPLTDTALRLQVVSAQSGAPLTSVMVQVPKLAVGEHARVAFGSWVPTEAGELPVTIRAESADPAGSIAGILHVGDRPVGTFTLDRQTVPEGTQTVHASINLQGVDLTQATLTDPLYLSVRDAIERGGRYVAREAVNWQKTNRCQGCHIEAQSVLGLASSFDKAPIDKDAAQFLYNGIAGTLQPTGALIDAYPQYSLAQTGFCAWGLTAWPDKHQSFRSQYKSGLYLLGYRRESGDYTFWSLDRNEAWWDSDEAKTAIVVKNLVDVLQSAGQDLGALGGYSVQPLFSSPALYQPQDMEWGPDGLLYVLTRDGKVWTLDPDSGSAEVYVSGLPADGRGLAVAADQILYVATANGRLIRVGADGSWAYLPASFPSAWDVELGPDGRLYVSDVSNNRIWRLFPDDPSGSVWISGGQLSGPRGLAFGPDGALYVSNFGGFNILSIDPAGTVSVFADGLPFQPLYLDADAAGGLYYTSDRRSYYYMDAPQGLNRVRADGTIERLTEVKYATGVAVSPAGVFVAGRDANSILRLVETPLDMTGLDGIRTQVLRAARYFLGRANSYTGSHLGTRAAILSGLGETLKIVDDPALAAQIETAMANTAAYLRSAQRADGGWGKYLGWGSDPLISALVGLALDYTNPSPDDPQVRAAILYLLNAQQTDGSWSSSIMSTRLSATSLVMDYLPKALDRLGGINVNVHLTLPDNITLSAPNRLPDSSPNPAGGTDYLWHLVGVTSEGRSLGFDLSFHDMALHETRPAATRAELEFANSFADGTLTLPLAIPSLTVDAGAKLAVSTARSSYGAGEDVAISARVANTSTAPLSGSVQLGIYVPGAQTPIAQLAPLRLSDLPAGQQRVLPALWNTGSTLVGHYEVRAKLQDARASELDRASAAFSIFAPSAVLSGRVRTDRPVYDPSDQVLVNVDLTNQSTNAIQGPEHVQVRVLDPSGIPVFSTTLAVGELLPDGGTALQVAVPLIQASEGSYRVEVLALDDATGQPVSGAQTGFQVLRQSAALAGSVWMDQTEVGVGDPELCHARIDSLSADSLPGTQARLLLVGADTQTIVASWDARMDLAPEGSFDLSRDMDTASLTPGGYVCLLQGAFGGTWQTLDFAGFQVVLRWHVQGDLSVDPRGGRLLVLMDAQAPSGGDPQGPSTALPSPDVQRQTLQGLLRSAGWSYTIVTDADAFTHGLRSGGYTSYALLSEHIKLPDQVEKELREAVYRGEGLVAAGAHDQRNRAIEQALGIKQLGNLPQAVAVTLADSDVHAAGSAAFGVQTKVLAAELQGAQPIGDYVESANGTGQTEAQPAVTLNHYGQGWAVYCGFDLLAEAAVDQAPPLFGELLLGGLARVRPEVTEFAPADVVPLRLTLDNLGIDATGQVVLDPLNLRMVDPRTAKIDDTGTLVWPFDLAENETVERRFWLALPEAGDPLSLQALIYVDRPDDEPLLLDTLSLVLEPGTAVSLVDALDALCILNERDATLYGAAYSLVQQAYTLFGEGDSAGALAAAVQAADALTAIDTQAAADARQLLDQAIRQLEISLQPTADAQAN